MTEPEYFRGFAQHARNSSVEIEISKEHGVPLTLVRHAERLKDAAEHQAKRERDSFLSFDEVWCVFDVDEHPNINEARQFAAARSIELAVSNPCFEIWLLLHFRDSPGARHRHDVQGMVEAYLPRYDKHLDFDTLASRVAGATRRARRLDEDAAEEGEPGRNPSTGVHRLAASIRGSEMA